MNIFSRDTLPQLLLDRPSPCVSLIVATEHGPEGAKRARLAWKNVMSQARDVLGATQRSRETDDLLAPAEALFADKLFWHDTAGGLAMFLSSDDQLLYRLPQAVGDFAIVGDHFAISPLVALIQTEQPYYVLSLSRNHVKMHRGTRSTFSEFDVPELPDSLDDALWYESHENLKHGGAEPSDERKQQLERYFKKVDDAIIAALNGQHAPLVLAAVEREVSGYREVSRYAHIAVGAVLGNPDRLELSHLHEQSWKMAETALMPLRQGVLERYQSLAGTGRTSEDVREIRVAAVAGMVDTLFVAELTDPTAHAEINDIVVATLRTGGDVISGLPTLMAPTTTLAATLRAGVITLAE